MRKKTKWDGIRIGDKVRHGEYGLGDVESKKGSGDDARVLVSFRGGELRELALKYARLKILKQARLR